MVIRYPRDFRKVLNCFKDDESSVIRELFTFELLISGSTVNVDFSILSCFMFTKST